MCISIFLRLWRSGKEVTMHAVWRLEQPSHMHLVHNQISNHMTITWPSHDHHMTVTWPSHEQTVVLVLSITWPSHDHHMTVTWPSHCRLWGCTISLQWRRCHCWRSSPPNRHQRILQVASPLTHATLTTYTHTHHAVWFNQILCSTNVSTRVPQTSNIQL